MSSNRNTTLKLSLSLIALFLILGLEAQTAPPASPQNNNIAELLIGKWFGGSEDDPEEEKGHMIFDEENGATLIIGDETIGGPDYVVQGTKVNLIYEVDATSTPAHLDLIFNVGSSEFGRMKGIIKFLSNDQFTINLASDPSNPRPTSFEEGDVAIFDRVK